MTKAKYTSVFFIFFLFMCYARPVLAQDTCVVLSKQIGPYIQAFEGIEEELGSSSLKRYDLDGRRDRGVGVVRRIRKNGCRVVVAVGSLALDVLRLQIQDRPIIYTMVAMPPSSVRDAQNISGISIEPPAADLMRQLKRLMPNCGKVGVVYDPAYSSEYVARLKAAAKDAGIVVEERQSSTSGAAIRAIDRLIHRVDAFLMVPDPVSANRTVFEFMLLEGLRHGAPVIGLSRKHVKEGALFTLVIDYRKTGINTGRLVERVLSGTPVQSLRRETTGQTSMLINLKMAKKMGLDIDESLVREAAEVFR